MLPALSLHTMSSITIHGKDYFTDRGRILGRNPDKSLTESPLQLCIKIFISSNSRNLLQFL